MKISSDIISCAHYIRQIRVEPFENKSILKESSDIGFTDKEAVTLAWEVMKNTYGFSDEVFGYFDANVTLEADMFIVTFHANHMGLIHMGSDNKSMIAFQKARCKLIPNFVGFLRRYLSRAKGLAYLIGNHVPLLGAACTGLIFFFGQQKFSLHRSGVAGKCGNQLAAVGFFWIFHIIRACAQTLRNGFPLVAMHGDNARGCHGDHSLLYLKSKKTTPGVVVFTHSFIQKCDEVSLKWQLFCETMGCIAEDFCV